MLVGTEYSLGDLQKTRMEPWLDVNSRGATWACSLAVMEKSLSLSSMAGMMFSLAFLGLGLTVIYRNPHEKAMWANGDHHLHHHGFGDCRRLLHWTWANHMGIQLWDLPIEAPSSGGQLGRGH